MTLDRVLWELKQHVQVSPKDGGSPYAYRFYRPDELDEDGRLAGDEFADAQRIEVRVFYNGHYTLTPTDEAGRHLAAPHPPELTDPVPMVIGDAGVAVPGAIKHPIPDEPPVDAALEQRVFAEADRGNLDADQAMEVLREKTDAKRKARLRKLLMG